MSYREGDTLLSLARDHGALVWFVCDGRGLCRTCACRVLSGAANLSAPTRLEIALIPEEQRRKGYRLSCQARFTGPGDVQVVSVAEQLRQDAVQIVGLGEGSAGEALGRLIEKFAGFALNSARSLPDIARELLPQLVAAPPTLSGVWKYAADTGRIAWRMVSKDRVEE